MLHTVKQIIDNQALFKKEIIAYIKADVSDMMGVLNGISSDDEFINQQADVLKKKIKKVRPSSVHELFFMNKKRSKKYYVWWDKNNDEATIYPYQENG